MITLKERILKEMVETPEDKIVRTLRNESSFNEEEVRRLCRKLTKQDALRGKNDE